MTDEMIPDYTILDESVLPHKFKIGDEVFEASPILPIPARKVWQHRIANAFDATGRLADGKDQDELADAFGEFLDLTLLPESMVRFTARIEDKVRPLSDSQVAMIVLGLIGHYAGRPTQPSSFTNDGRLSESSSSTGGQPLEVSIPAASPIIGI